MKKLPVFVIIALISAMMTGCANKANDELKATVVVEDVTVTTADTAEEVSAQKMVVKDEIVTYKDNSEMEQTSVRQYQEVSLRETISLGFTEIFLDGFSIDTEVYPKDTSGVYMYLPEIPGKKYFQLIGTLKNTSTDMYEIDNMCIKLVFDDKYNYDGYLKADAGVFRAFDYQVYPFESVDIHIIGEIPDELVNNFQKCTVIWGFKENFERAKSLDDCDYVYQIEYT